MMTLATFLHYSRVTFGAKDRVLARSQLFSLIVVTFPLNHTAQIKTSGGKGVRFRGGAKIQDLPRTGIIREDLESCQGHIVNGDARDDVGDLLVRFKIPSVVELELLVAPGEGDAIVAELNSIEICGVISEELEQRGELKDFCFVFYSCFFWIEMRSEERERESRMKKKKGQKEKESYQGSGIVSID